MAPTSDSSRSGGDAAHIRRVLQGLRLNRTPGWHFPAHYLGLYFSSLDEEQVEVAMPVDSPGIDAQGQVVPAALAALADTALTAALRGRSGKEVRLATVSMNLSFASLQVQDTLRARGHCKFRVKDIAMPMAVTSLTVTSGEQVVCSGEASIAVLDNRRGMAPHPLSGARRFDEVEPLGLAELTQAEQQVLDAARGASAACRGGDRSFLEGFWGLVPTMVGEGTAECSMACGMHVSNRVGDVQGGVLLGLTAHTSAAVLGDRWQLLDVAAQFVAAGTGPRLHAKAQALRVGRNTGTVGCTVLDDAGRVVLRAQATLVRKLASSHS